MSEIPARVVCFMIEPTRKVHRSLRRFVWSSQDGAKCPGPYAYHNVMAPLDTVETEVATEVLHIRDEGVPHDDARWPTQCSCGYVFTDGDAWQVFLDRVWRRPDTGEEMTLRTAPAGAMYDAYWYRENDPRHLGPDELALHVVLPPAGGEVDHWHIDGPARDGGKWTRTGTPPLVTASPSILTSRYHGFLRNGVLESC